MSLKEVSAQAPEPVRRPVGLETELGVLAPGDPLANPVVLSSELVSAYAAYSRLGLRRDDGAPAPAVRWDYEAEDPLADLRGGRLERSAAHPSMLTDDPHAPAPSGDAPVQVGPAASAGRVAPEAGLDLGDLPAGPWGTRPRPSPSERALLREAGAVLTNGARFYVDHAHPEYSSPEVLTPMDAVVWDRAGEVVARQAMALLAGQGRQVALYKNNVDGKGAAYGAHENYLVRRDLPFGTLAAALVPFMATRPVLVGAGRVGLGQRSQRPGFQISQRADYVGCETGLQTTFNRPLVNTRDEPHADKGRWRRLHVINADANHFEVPIYLRVATTNLLLWYLERAHRRGGGLGDLAGLQIQGDPVEQHWQMSHDTTLAHTYRTARGPLTALSIQRLHLEAIKAAIIADYGGASASQVGWDTAQALELWDQVLGVLDGLAQAQAPGTLAPARRAALAQAAPLVEWVAKLEVCQALLARAGTGWDDPRVAAVDLQWADLRAGKGVAERLTTAGRTQRLVTDAQIAHAATHPPQGTRAVVRGEAVARHPEVVAASWTSLVLDVPGRSQLLRVELCRDVVCDQERARSALADIAGVLRLSKGLGS